MKVLIVSTVPYTLNGISNVIVSSVENLKKINSDIQITIAKSGNINDSYKNRLNGLVDFIDVPLRKNIFQYAYFMKKIGKGYDIVHIHGNSATMSLELIAFFSIRKRIIVHGHAAQCTHNYIHKFLKPFFNKFTYNKIACSEEAGNFLYKRPFNIIPNGINSALFKYSDDNRNQLRREYKLENNQVFLHVGGFNLVKNQKFLLECFEKISDENKKLVLIGEGEEKNKLMAEFSHNKNILFLDSKKDIYRYYSMADVFVLPSLYESFGLVLLEAQINGLPCIVSDNVSKSSLVSSELVEYLPLTQELWIESINNDHNRSNVNNVDFSQFDIYQINLRLYNYYCKVVQKVN